MAEYVTKEALYDLATYHGNMSTLNNLNPIYVKAVAVSVIKEMPSEDVAPVVFCKDCKYAGRGFTGKDHRCAIFNAMVWYDDYCSYGEHGDAPKPKNYAPIGQEDNWA